MGCLTLALLGVCLGAVHASGAQSDASAAQVGQLPPIHADSTLEDLIRYAEAASPRLEAARRRHLAGLQTVPQARALPDPRFTASIAVVPVETRVGPQRGQLSIAQMFPGFGKRDARAAVARASATKAESEHERERHRLVFAVADAYYESYFLTRAFQITRDNRDVLVFFEQAVRKAYETGKASYADLIRSQVEIGKLENELRSLGEGLETVQETLNSLLHRPATAVLPRPRLPETLPTIPSEEELRQRLEQDSPELVVLDAKLQRDSSGARLSDLAARPDWNLSLSYFPTDPAILPGTPDSGQDPLVAGVTLNLPLGRKKYRAEREAARERLLSTEAERNAQVDRLHARLGQVLYGYRNADREVGLYRDTLLPKAEQSFEASQAGVRTGEAGALELVDAQRVLLQFQLAYERALTERVRAIAELRLLLGGEPSATVAPGEAP